MNNNSNPELKLIKINVLLTSVPDKGYRNSSMAAYMGDKAKMY